MDHVFDAAQACYDAAEPEEHELAPAGPIREALEGMISALDEEGWIDDSQEVHRLSDRQATVGVWIDGHEYSLTLNRED